MIQAERQTSDESRCAITFDEARRMAREHLLAGSKPRNEWHCGVELELIGYDARRDFARLNPAQVARVMRRLADSSSAQGEARFVYEGETLIEICDAAGARTTIEPGGQIEFSDPPHKTLCELERALRARLAQLHEIATGENFIFVAAGFDPLRALGEQHWYPKRRYGVMRPFLAARGARGLDMMTRTCAAQVSLDYDCAEDAMRKYIVANRLAPIATAIFANSPFADGKSSGLKSTRADCWLDTDSERCGVAPLALADFTVENGSVTASIEEFIDYAFSLPLMFVRRGYEEDSQYISLDEEMTCGEFFRCGVAHGFKPQFFDFTTHLSTIFTDARLKRIVELRSADCNDLHTVLALTAFWKGLLYDSNALSEAERLAPHLTRTEAFELREAVARNALAANVKKVNVRPLAQQLIEIAAAGLARVAPDESHYLDSLRERVAEGVCPADILLRNFRGAWREDMREALKFLRVA